MASLLATMPLPLLGILVVGGAVLTALAGLVVVRRVVPLHHLEEHNEIAGFVYAVIGVIFAVLLAFVTIDVWEQFQSAAETVDQEASVLDALYRDANAYPDGVRQAVQERLRGYGQAVVEDEWAHLARGQASPLAESRLDALFAAYREINPQTPRDSAWHAESLKNLNELSEYRDSRLFQSREALPATLWSIILMASMATVSFTYLFGAKNVVVHGVIVAFLTTTVACVLLAVMALDHPYVGDYSVSPEPLESVLRSFEPGSP